MTSFLTSRIARKRITIQGEGDFDELKDDEGILALCVCVMQAEGLVDVVTCKDAGIVVSPLCVHQSSTVLKTV